MEVSYSITTLLLFCKYSIVTPFELQIIKPVSHIIKKIDKLKQMQTVISLMWQHIWTNRVWHTNT